MGTTEELFTEPDTSLIAPVNTADVATKMYAISKLENEIQGYLNQKKEADYFYEQRINNIENRIAYLKEQISSWMTVNEKELIATHNGTAFLQKSTVVTWPSAPVLLDWVKKEQIPDGIRTKEEPSLKEINQYMKETGLIPPSYLEVEKTSLRIRKV